MKKYTLLSDAILDGAASTAQCVIGLLIDRHGNTCALGAACYAVSEGRGNFNNPNYPALRDMFHDILLHPVKGCPHSDCECDLRGTSVEFTITHLNDGHEWKRERIAGWLATIEEKLGMVEILTEESSHSKAFGVQPHGWSVSVGKE